MLFGQSPLYTIERRIDLTMPEKIRVLIADDIRETRENIKRLLQFADRVEVVGEAANGEESVLLAEKLRPDIVLMDVNMPVLDGISATEMITTRVPQSTIIILSVQGEQEYLKRAMAAGAREYLVKPFAGDELTETIYTVFDMEKKRRAYQAAMESMQKHNQPAGRVITVFSSKGGVGKTTIATNLAVAITRLTQKKVALLDLDLSFGDVAVMLNLLPRQTLADLAQESNPLEPEVLEPYMVKHSSGVEVLAAPPKPEYAEFIGQGHIEKLISTMKRMYDYIIVDTSQGFSDPILISLDNADQILLISTLDIPTVKNIRLCLEVMDSLHYTPEKIKLVLNRASVDMGIRYKDVEVTLSRPIFASLPSDEQAAVTAANKGIPFVISYPSSRLTQAVMKLADQVILPRDRVGVKGRGIFSRMIG